MNKRVYEQLSESERQAIALGLQQGQSMRAIARALGRSASTISREIERNSGGSGYSSKPAQQRCERNRRFARPAPSCTAAARCLSACAPGCASAGRPSKLPGT